ncbi:MAG TPA: SusD/RagB family nutrient-binding outer membrane lipoprotein [Puia sp.]
MKKILHILLLVAVAGVISPACKKSFESLYQNTNKPTKVPPSLLLNGVLFDMYDAPYSMQERWAQYYACNYDYYGNNRYDFGAVNNSFTDYYNTLKNVGYMEQAAIAYGGNAVNPYEALAKFFRAYFFTKVSLLVGDVPMTDALKGATNLTPKYNTQKDVFKQAFLWLDSANTDLGKLISSPDNKNLSDGQTLKGDFFLGNSLAGWRKVVNTYRLRMLIELSKRADDNADLNVKTQFATIVGNPTQYPIMTSAGDNLQFAYVHPTNDYPMNPGNFGFDALRYNMTATYVGMLTSLQDPRVFVTAEPASALVTGSVKTTDFAAFVGAPSGEDLGVMYIKANAGQYSLINRKHFYDTYTGEPSIQIGYPELLFNIAEAINRGWITAGPLGDAEAHYTAAIQASWAFYGIPTTGAMTAYFLHPGASLGTYDPYTVNVDYATYYNRAAVKYAGNTATGLTQILQQRYLALFRHSGMEPYFTWRRTGVPAFSTGPGTGNSSRIALRFQYQGSEKSANATNYAAALQSQYGGNDDINGQMWIIK